MVWEQVLDVFRDSIENKGFYHWNQSFQAFKREHNLEAQQRAPQYLSLDFYSKQRPELTDLQWYVIRLGQGNFGIFDETKIPKPYLKLDISTAENIEIYPKKSYINMRRAFKSLDFSLKSAENSLLELSRFYGIFGSMVSAIDGSSEYQVGPRGLSTQRFDLYFKQDEDEPLKLEYNGQVELDYSVWTEDRVFVVEAKSITNYGLDIGWHKMAFPSRRFVNQVVENGLKVNPVYFLRTRIEGKHMILVFVFTEMKFKDMGIVLNDEERWELLKVLRVDIDDIDSQLR